MTLTTEGDAFADCDELGEPLTVLDTDAELLIVFEEVRVILAVVERTADGDTEELPDALGDEDTVLDNAADEVPFAGEALEDTVVEGLADTLLVTFAVLDAVDDPVTVLLTELDLETDTDADTVDDGEIDKLKQLVTELSGDVLLVLHGDEDDDGHAVVEPVRDVDGDPDELR